jgi:four helix bundle protein
MSDIKNSNSIIARKSYLFSLEIIKCYKSLSDSKKEYVLSKQLLRSGTSIGSNVNEALSAESKKDFIHKLGIALKEAKETSYWLNLLGDSDYISKDVFISLIGLCNELNKILSSIILTTKEKYIDNKQKTHNS